MGKGLKEGEMRGMIKRMRGEGPKSERKGRSRKFKVRN